MFIEYKGPYWFDYTLPKPYRFTITKDYGRFQVYQVKKEYTYEV